MIEKVPPVALSGITLLKSVQTGFEVII